MNVLKHVFKNAWIINKGKLTTPVFDPLKQIIYIDTIHINAFIYQTSIMMAAGKATYFCILKW